MCQAKGGEDRNGDFREANHKRNIVINSPRVNVILISNLCYTSFRKILGVLSFTVGKKQQLLFQAIKFFSSPNDKDVMQFILIFISPFLICTYLKIEK